MPLSRIESNTERSGLTLTLRLVPGVLALFLVFALWCTAQARQQSPIQDHDVYDSAIRSFLVAERDALDSGDPDRILKNSAPVAVASLAYLTRLDKQDQQSRNVLDALPYAQGLLSDLSTELLLLQMELNLGEVGPARELKRHILETNHEDANLHVTLCGILGFGKQLEDAVREAQRAVELDPSSREAQTALGKAYWGFNGFQYNEEALRAFTAAHELDPDGFTTNLFLGSIESQYRRFDAASVHLRAAAAADPSAPEPLYHLGMNAYEQSRPKEAAELLEHFVSLAEAGNNGKPSQVRQALLTLDQIAEEQGRVPEAGHRAEEEALKQQLLQSGVAKSGEESALPMGSSDTEDRSPLAEDPATTTSTTATVQQLRELAANSLGNIGTGYARKHDFAAAIVPFRFSVAEDPTQELVIRNLGLAACVGGSFEETVHALKKIVAAHADDLTARGCLGTAELETGEFSEAATTFAYMGTALSTMPLYAAAAALAFARAGERERAQKTLDALETADPNPKLQAREAMAYLDLGKEDRAADLAEKAANGSSSAPPEALRVLGVLDLERGDAAKAAVEFRKECQAYREGGGDPLEPQALLAEALIKSGNQSEGEEISVRLGRANPDLVKILVRESEELLKNGDSHAAYQKAAAAMALAPRDKQIRATFESATRALHTPNR